MTTIIKSHNAFMYFTNSIVGLKSHILDILRKSIMFLFEEFKIKNLLKIEK